MFYIFVEDGKINGCGQAQIVGENVINHEVNEALYNEFSTNPDKYIWDGLQVVENPNYEQEQAKARQKEFESKFLLTSLGNYRLQPKGYANAQQSIDTINNMVNALGSLTNQISEMVLFYETPNFKDETQCTEEWLIKHQYKAPVMTKEEWTSFYIEFSTLYAQSQYK